MKVIVDLGCGDAKGTVLLAKKNPNARVIGIDYSPVTAERARKSVSESGLKNIEIRNGNPTKSDLFAAQSVDEVVFNFPKMKGFWDALNNATGWIKPEGGVKIRLWPSPLEYSPDRLEKFFRERGFRVVQGTQRMDFKRPPLSTSESEVPKSYPLVFARRGGTVPTTRDFFEMLSRGIQRGKRVKMTLPARRR